MSNVAINKQYKQSTKKTKYFKNEDRRMPGILMVMVIAVVAQIIGTQYPVIGGAVTAIILGILLKNFFVVPDVFEKGIEYTMKKLLKVAIVLLGFSFTFTQILLVGVNSLVLVTVSVVSALVLTYVIGRLLGLYGDVSILIGIGTAICGATAIASTAPILKAKEEDLTYAINTIFAFNVLAILAYPYIGMMLGMTDEQFGMWSGAAIHDTSSVVAAGYAFSTGAGDSAVVVKMVRTLMLIPLSLLLAIFISWKLKKETVQEGIAEEHKRKVEIKKIFPYFILVFAGVALINTFVSIPVIVTDSLANMAKFLIVMVMVSVGLKTDVGKIKRVGFKPLLVGLIASVLMGGITISLIYAMT